MGRPALGLKYVQVGLAEGVLGRIDAVVGSGGRAAFIREAVDRALSLKVSDVDIPADGGPGPVRVIEPSRAEVVPVKPKGGAVSGDYPLVLRYLGDGSRALRPLASDLGWDAGRLDRVLSKMDAAGLISYVGGVARLV